MQASSTLSTDWTRSQMSPQFTLRIVLALLAALCFAGPSEAGQPIRPMLSQQHLNAHTLAGQKTTLLKVKTLSQIFRHRRR